MESYVAAAYEDEMFIEAIRVWYIIAFGSTMVKYWNGSLHNDTNRLCTSLLATKLLDLWCMTWAAPEEYLEYRNGGQALKPENIEDYARFLTSSVQYLANHGVHIM